jgi:hypothetical protein
VVGTDELQSVGEEAFFGERLNLGADGLRWMHKEKRQVRGEQDLEIKNALFSVNATAELT